MALKTALQSATTTHSQAEQLLNATARLHTAILYIHQPTTCS
jgi:hypothetical protein